MLMQSAAGALHGVCRIKPKARKLSQEWAALWEFKSFTSPWSKRSLAPVPFLIHCRLPSCKCIQEAFPLEKGSLLSKPATHFLRLQFFLFIAFLMLLVSSYFPSIFFSIFTATVNVRSIVQLIFFLFFLSITKATSNSYSHFQYICFFLVS